MALTQNQIINAFDAMGLVGPPGSPNAAPSAAVIASLEAIGDTYAGLNALISLPEVQNQVIPILAMFDLSLGHDPLSATLSSMVESGLTEQQIADAFVEDATFAATYYNGENFNSSTIIDSANSGIITALFLNGLGHAPTVSTLEGFYGLTLGQAFLVFTQSNAIAVTGTINSSLTQILELAAGIPAQGPTPTPQNFTLTNGSDSVISGQDTVQTTTPGVLVQTTGDVTVNAPLSGPFGNQPTLTVGDVINLQGTQNTLNALFDGNDILTGMTIKGVQTWNITQDSLGGGTTVAIEGTTGTIDGVTTLNYSGNGFNDTTFQVGITGHGIDATTPANGFTLGVSNTGADSNAIVFFDPKSFSVGGGDIINVNANDVGNTTGGTSTSIITSTFIEAGSGGASGFATWNVNSTGANALNNIGLGALGSKAATTLNVTDDGSATIIYNAGDAADWANLAVIDAVGTSGALTITGGEFGGFGLLSDDHTALTTVEGGSGADTFDLSAYTGTVAQVAGLSILGGANTTIELSNTEINTISTVASGAFAAWSSVAVLEDVASPGVGGLINMADFPGTLTVSLLSPTSGLNPNQTSNLNVTNAPDGLNFDFNSTDQQGHNFSVVGSDTAGGVGNVVNVNYGSIANTFSSMGAFSAQNFDFVNINLTGGEPFPILRDFYFHGITAIANADAPETLTINASLTHTGGETVWVGNISTQTLGVDDITLLGGGITVAPPLAHFNLTGTLDITGTDDVVIGITNASTIHSTTTGEFQMWSPDDFVDLAPTPLWLSGTGITADSATAGSILQGSLGAGFVAGNDTLTDNAGGTTFMGDAGADVFNLGGGGSNNVVFGEGLLNDNGLRVAVTSNTDHGAGGFWGVANGLGDNNPNPISASTSADMSTINGFTMTGINHDVLTFDADAWAGGSINAGGLVTGSGFAIPPVGNSVMQLVGSGGTVNLATDVVLYTEGGLTSAADLAADLSGAGAIHFTGGADITSGNHMLFAYDSGANIIIADVDFLNGIAGESTAGRHIVASDVAEIVGGNNGTTTSLAILGANPADIHFIHV